MWEMLVTADELCGGFLEGAGYILGGTGELGLLLLSAKVKGHKYHIIIAYLCYFPCNKA